MRPIGPSEAFRPGVRPPDLKAEFDCPAAAMDKFSKARPKGPSSK